MTSNDNYVTVEIFNAGISRLEALNEKNLALIQKENAEFRLQLREDVNNFKNEVRSDINNFKNEIRSDIENFKNETRAEFSQIHAEIVQLDKKIEVPNARVDDLFHWDYWILSIILVFVAMPHIINGVKSLFEVLTDGIAGIMALFRRKGQNAYE